MEFLYVFFGLFGYAIIGVLVVFVLTTMPMLNLKWNFDGMEEVAVIWPLVVVGGILMSIFMPVIAIYCALHE